jgi:carbon starvation protein
MSVPTMPRRLDARQIATWSAVAILGAVAWAVLALARGESVNAVWMLFAALCSYAIAYRFYARFIASRVLGVDNHRATPAERLDNAIDFHKTDRRVLFGHHFAAIAGAGPLVGRCWPPRWATCPARSGSSSG